MREDLSQYSEIKQDIIFPDFIIGGAMKSGTTSIHNILSAHPNIFIPKEEIFFYDIDDILRHPDFFLYENNSWYYPLFEKNVQDYLEWYSSFFKSANDNQIIGEDSTTYLASVIAPQRISELNPNAKIIISLRDPASRCYSHYLHMVRTGRTSKKFEEFIQINGGSVIDWSIYKPKIENFFSFIPKNKIKFVIFEEFIENLGSTIIDLFEFIGVDAQKLDLNSINLHSNKTLMRKNIPLQLYVNKLLRNRQRNRYLDHLINMPKSIKEDRSLLLKVICKVHNLVNPIGKGNKPGMKAETRDFLNDYFRVKNDGLDNLINKDVNDYWFN